MPDRIRKCPDCHGRGRIWVPIWKRESRQYWQGALSATDVHCVVTTRPEWEACELCGGSGKVRCEAVQEATNATPDNAP